jgi:G:T-mismatch repair DNA endonuclease (very short patch repair protein)
MKIFFNDSGFIPMKPDVSKSLWQGKRSGRYIIKNNGERMKTFERNCKICGTFFIARNVRKMFCSNACRVKSSENNDKRLYRIKCKNCKEYFMSKNKKVKFCSTSCSATNKNKIGNGKIFECKNCRKTFNQKHKRHYFCSSECKKKYNYSLSEKIKVKCSNCEKEIERNKNASKNNKNFFCSKECDAEFRHALSSENRFCEYCKNIFSCNKSEKLRFCSVGCQTEWQKITGMGKNHPSYNHDITDEMRTKKCECCGSEMKGTPKEFEKKKYCSYSCKVKMMPKSMSFPHLQVIKILDELSIDNEIELRVGRYSVDCYIKNTNLVIEVMGTFWHCDNRRYKNPISRIQEKSIKRDRRKKEEIYNKEFIPLYLWEIDICDDYETCKKLIKEFVERNGKLNNYHSMNYIMKNEEIKLRSKILFPFFEK